MLPNPRPRTPARLPSSSHRKRNRGVEDDADPSNQTHTSSSPTTKSSSSRTKAKKEKKKERKETRNRSVAKATSRPFHLDAEVAQHTHQPSKITAAVDDNEEDANEEEDDYFPQEDWWSSTTSSLAHQQQQQELTEAEEGDEDDNNHDEDDDEHDGDNDDDEHDDDNGAAEEAEEEARLSASLRPHKRRAFPRSRLLDSDEEGEIVQGLEEQSAHSLPIHANVSSSIIPAPVTAPIKKKKKKSQDTSMAVSSTTATTSSVLGDVATISLPGLSQHHPIMPQQHTSTNNTTSPSSTTTAANNNTSNANNNSSSVMLTTSNLNGNLALPSSVNGINSGTSSLNNNLIVGSPSSNNYLNNTNILPTPLSSTVPSVPSFNTGNTLSLPGHTVTGVSLTGRPEVDAILLAQHNMLMLLQQQLAALTTPPTNNPVSMNPSLSVLHSTNLPPTMTTHSNTLSDTGGSSAPIGGRTVSHLDGTGPSLGQQPTATTTSYPTNSNSNTVITTTTPTADFKKLSYSLAPIEVHQWITSMKSLFLTGVQDVKPAYGNFMEFDCSNSLHAVFQVLEALRPGTFEPNEDFSQWSSWSLEKLAKALSAHVNMQQAPVGDPQTDPYHYCERLIPTVIFPQSYDISKKELATDFLTQCTRLDTLCGKYFAVLSKEKQRELLIQLVHRICTKPDDIQTNHPLRILARAVKDQVDSIKSFTDLSVKAAIIVNENAKRHELNKAESSQVKYDVKPLPTRMRPTDPGEHSIMAGHMGFPPTNSTYSTTDDFSSYNSQQTSNKFTTKSNKDKQTNGKSNNKQKEKQNKTQSQNNTNTNSNTTHTNNNIVPGQNWRTNKPRPASQIPPWKGKEDPQKPGKYKCYLCGHTHGNNSCLQNCHPNVNTENKPWPESTIGKLFAEKQIYQLPPRKTLSDQPFHNEAFESLIGKASQQRASRAEAKHHKGEMHRLLTIYEDLTNSDDLIDCYIDLDRKRKKELNAKALVDTGALCANYISPDFAAKLQLLGFQLHYCSTDNKVCTVITDANNVKSQRCIPIHNYMFFNLKLNDVIATHDPTLLYNKTIINFHAWVLPIPCDIIIGRPTIREHRLLKLLENHFAPRQSTINKNTTTCSSISACQKCCNMDYCVATGGIAEPKKATTGAPLKDTLDTADYVLRSDHGPDNSGVHCRVCHGDACDIALLHDVAKPPNIIAMMQHEVKRLDELLQRAQDEILEDTFQGLVDLGDMLDASIKVTKDNDPLPAMMGDTNFHKRIRALCSKRSRVFSREVKPTPAYVEALELRIKSGAKFTARPSGPPRLQSPEKSKEIHRQLEQMMRLNIIRPSTAQHYSQVILAVKPGGKWRFCIDYRELNKDLETEFWVIPNIKQLLQRIGHKKPKYFAVMDLTSGYHQAPLAENSRHLAAFITPFGIFEPVRVPMGVHVAPAYFQRVIAGTLMREFMYKFMEMYIDDIIVYGETEEEFLQNLDKVLTKCEAANITLHPDKCKLGVESIEYVGHVLDKDGIHMSDEKIRKVLDFARPRTVKQLQSFLGLINYFHDHIPNHSIIAKPLYEMTTGLKGSTILKWSHEQHQAFENLKRAAEHCPKLYYLHEDKSYSTFVETDACDYGIGAYLYQTKPGDSKQYPIAYLSKSLSSAERKWSTIEKEQYAIFFALRKWEYLLRGIPFTLRTDHKNLLAMNDSSPKVLRWKLALQEYNCEVEHISGVNNFVADQLSRLVDDGTEPSPSTIATSPPQPQVLAAMGYQDIFIPDEKHKLIKDFHNTLSGHWGVEKTIELMLAKGVQPWRSMRTHVKKFVRECPACQKMSHISAVHNVKPYTVSSYRPMQRISIDTIGPIESPTTAKNNNTTPHTSSNCPKLKYEHVLVIIDNFSRFVSLYPCVSTGAEEAARYLFDHIERYGAPDQIQSDKGSQFVNDTIKYLYKRIGIEPIHGMAYSKEENSIVERANKEVLRHIRAFIYETNILDKWVDCLPMVQRIINASVHESTGVSPAKIIFGNSIDLDRGIFPNYIPTDEMDGTAGNTQNHTLRTWIDGLWKAQQEILHKAIERQLGVNEENVAQRDPTSPVTEYSPGTYVLANYPPDSTGNHKPPSKLHPIWRGPFRVANSSGPMVEIQNLLNGKMETLHIRRLKPFYHNPNHTDPKTVALRDQQETFVEKILEHRGDFKHKKSLLFKVQWQNIPVSDSDPWLPWSELRLVTAMHQYLRERNLQKYIPHNLEQWEEVRTEAERQAEVLMHELRRQQNMIAADEARQTEPTLIPPALPTTITTINHNAITHSGEQPQPTTAAVQGDESVRRRSGRKRKLKTPTILPETPNQHKQNKKGRRRKLMQHKSGKKSKKPKPTTI